MSTAHLLIHDFDGTLYPFPENPLEIFGGFNERVVEEISAGLIKSAAARDLGLKSYLETGLSFRQVAEQVNMHLAEAAAIHHRHAVFDLQEDPALIRAYKATKDTTIISMILTQGTRCNIERHLPKIGLSDHFPKNMWLATDETGFDDLKATSMRPWLMAKIWAENVTGLTFDDSNIHVFEDTPGNLVIPHQMGWNTVLIHGGNPLAELPEHVHRQDKTPADRVIELAAFYEPALGPSMGL